jgi:AraC-like DNA-binding protein
VLEGHAANVVRPGSPSHESIVDSVRGVVVTRLAHGVPDVDAVARQVSVSPRTLQRRLAAEGMSYQQIVDDVRRDAAGRLLADPSLAVSQVGYLLGFSEPSAFHRAFKRWHDSTPQEYRQRKSHS